MKSEPEWLTKQDLLALHEWLLAEHGGASGLLDNGLLEAALSSPRNQLAYASPDLHDLAAAYAFGITRNHPFRDGNKRVAFASAGIFLEMNGLRLEAPEPDALGAVLALSSGQMGQDEFAAWLRVSTVRIRPPVKRDRKGTRTRKKK